MVRSRAQSMNFGGQKDSEQRKRKQLVSELKEVTNYLKYEWPQLLDPNTNPIDLAVSLLDRLSVGLAHRMDDFHDISKQTQQALRNVVSLHHEVFNNSVGSYHLLLASLDSSQNDTAEIRQLLESTTRDISDRCDVLLELNQTSARYGDMVEILEAMDELTAVPDRVDQLIVDKKLDLVYDEIARAYALAEKYNLWTLSAMNSTQHYLEMQSNNLFDMVVDELQNELYLRSTGDAEEAPWQHYVAVSNPQVASFRRLVHLLDTLEQFIYNSANLDVVEVGDAFCDSVRHFLTEQLPRLHSHATQRPGDTNYALLLEAALNKNTESFHYIYLLLSTASRLNRLSQAVEILRLLVQLQVGQLLARVTEQTKLRNVRQLGKLAKLLSFDQAVSADDAVNGSTFSDVAVPVLADLFATVGVSCLAVVQRHKVVSEVVQCIETHQSLQPATGSISARSRSYDMAPVWSLVKKEIHALVARYIQELVVADDTAASLPARNDTFQFAAVAPGLMARTDVEMRTLLQERFPGFSVSSRAGDASELPYIDSDTATAEIEVLVPRNVFNMRVVLDFMLVFTAGTHRIFSDFASVGPENRTAVNFVDDFMASVFVPRLRATFDRYFDESVGLTQDSLLSQPISLQFSQTLLARSLRTDLHVLDSGHPELAIFRHDSARPTVYHNAVAFKKLLLNACSVLNTSLWVRTRYADVVLHLVGAFVAAYERFYRELVGADDAAIVGRPTLKVRGWMNMAALTEVSGSLLQHTASPSAVQPYVHKETSIILHGPEAFDVAADDFFDSDGFAHVCHLLVTTLWVLGWLPGLAKEGMASDRSHSDRPGPIRLRDEWCFLENGRVSPGALDHVFVAVDDDLARRFLRLVQSLGAVRDRTLLALRYDLRCKALFYIGRLFRDSDMVPLNAPGEADHYITQFNREVFAVDERLSSVLSDSERQGVFCGLAHYIEALVMAGTRLVGTINSNGIKRILLNTFALQQMLRTTLGDDVDFTRLSVYFELFTQPESAMVGIFESNRLGYTKGDMVELARLVYSERLADGGSAFNRGKYNELVRRAEEIFG